MSDVLLWDLVYNVISMWEIFGLQAIDGHFKLCATKNYYH